MLQFFTLSGSGLMQFFSKEKLANILLAVASLLLLALILEIGLRWSGFSKIYDIYTKQSLHWEYDAMLGWKHKNNAVFEFAGPRPFPIEFNNEIHINSDGLRGDEITDQDKGGFRILFLGDSKVAAFEVAYSETFVFLLQEKLSAELGVPIQVINAGVRGYGADQSFLYYTSRGYAFNPDLVIFMPSANDPIDNLTLHRLKRVFGKSALSFKGNQQPSLINSPVPRYSPCTRISMDHLYRVNQTDTFMDRLICRANLALLDHSVLASFVVTTIKKATSAVTAEEKQGQKVRTGNSEPIIISSAAESVSFPVAHNSRIVKAMQNSVTQNGSEFMVITQDYLQRQLDQEILAGVDVYSFAMDRSKTTWVNDSHYNSKGHRMVADNVWRPIANKLSLLKN